MSINVTTLKHLYEVERLNTRKIAEITGVSFRTIIRRLHQFGITLRCKGEEPNPFLKDKAWLLNQYLILKKPTTLIAEEIHCSNRTVYSWLLKHGIEVRGDGFKGKKLSEESKQLMSLAKKGKYIGSDNPNWRGGYVDPTARERRSYESKIWRLAVKQRDGYKCVECGAEKRLHAHHVKSWNKHPESRFDVDNGKTLCVVCHQKAHGFFFPNWLWRNPKSARPLKGEDIV